MQRSRLLAFWCALSITGSSLANEAVSESVRPRQAEPHPYSGTANCTFDRVLLGPSGTEVAVWPDANRSIIGLRRFSPPTEVIVGRLHGPQQRSRDRLFSYHGGGLRLIPIRWSNEGDRLYVRVREREQRVVAFTAEGAAVADIIPLDATWTRIDLNAVSHGDVSSLRDASAGRLTSRIDGTRLIRGSATLGAGLELLAARRSDLELVRVGTADETEVGLNASQVEVLTAFENDNDYQAGVGYLGSPLRGLDRYVPYQLPIIDLGTGRVKGAFGPTGLMLRIPSSLQSTLAEFSRTQTEHRLTILDASYSAGALAVLTMSGRGDRRLFRLGPTGISEQPICAAPASVASRPGILPLEGANGSYLPVIRAFTLDELGGETMVAGRPILLHHSLTPGGARDAVVYFHGGPGSTALNSSTEVRRILAPGRDVIAVEYSGSQGGGIELTRRLAHQGIRAIEADVDALAGWLQRQNYRRVFLLGASFGGVPAMVAVSRHPDIFSATFFVAPLLRYRTPEEWVSVGTSGYGAVMADTQLARDYAYYGGPAGQRRFAAQLHALVANARLTATQHFYFGADDPVSKQDDLPRDATSPRRVVPGGHPQVLSHHSVWSDIERAMERAESEDQLSGVETRGEAPMIHILAPIFRFQAQLSG